MKQILVVVISIVFSCQYQAETVTSSQRKIANHFAKQWYDGNAEINVYELRQARYGEMRDGIAVMIFVTEDFLPDKLVKYEFGEHNNKISVLKLNQIKRFETGIYDYSLMTSVFLPIQEDGPSLKTSHSSQDWCGHTWLQLTSEKSQYRINGFSYFQAEADQTIQIKKVYTENDIPLIYRINPEFSFHEIKELIPSPDFLRMKHQNTAAYPVEIKIQDLMNPEMSADSIREIRIHFTSLARFMSYYFERKGDFHLLGWNDQYQDSPKNKEMLISQAILKQSIRAPYWSQNSLADSLLRENLMKNQ